MDISSASDDEKKQIIDVLQNMGCCDLCILRYLGVTDPYIYRDRTAVRHKLYGDDDKDSGQIQDDDSSKSKEENLDLQPAQKVRKKNTCVACLGLLQEGIEESSLDHIVTQIISADIESYSFNPVLSMPLSIQIRAYSVWNCLEKKFPHIFTTKSTFKPEGMALKSVWKWVCSGILQHKINPASDWSVNGTLAVQLQPVYPDEEKEYIIIKSVVEHNISRNNYLAVGGFGRRKFVVSRGSVESALARLSIDTFEKHFPSPPPIPDSSMKIGDIVCAHIPLYIAGRYCKYSRKLSQTPWMIDGARKTETSVEELISSEILAMCGSTVATFTASGREDVDVRMLGAGRPFVMEVSNPKKTLFTVERMKQLQDAINKNTTLISVRDIQVVDKKDLTHLKHGEEEKTKTYCALCITPGGTVNAELLEKLNTVKLPLVLKQNTPVRVLHRRSVACRERSILAMEATLVPSSSNNMFKLQVKTQAGTYVKEFVHGDLGRTIPNVAGILGCDADIIGLDVEGVDLDWPPQIDARD